MEPKIHEPRRCASIPPSGLDGIDVHTRLRNAEHEIPCSCILLERLQLLENDAREFFDAYVKRTAKRYPDATLIPEAQFVSSNTHLSWQTSEGRVVIELRGLRVLVIEGIPEGVDAYTLVKVLWE